MGNLQPKTEKCCAPKKVAEEQRSSSSICSKIIFTTSMLGAVGLSILIATGQITFQSDSLSKIGEDCFLPNMQNININMKEINELFMAIKDKIPSSEEIAKSFVQFLNHVSDAVNSFNIYNEEKVPEASDASDDHMETLEIEQEPVKQEIERKQVKQEENVKPTYQESSK